LSDTVVWNFKISMIDKAALGSASNTVSPIMRAFYFTTLVDTLVAQASGVVTPVLLRKMLWGINLAELEKWGNTVLRMDGRFAPRWPDPSVARDKHR
jgi:hypothetical protein